MKSTIKFLIAAILFSSLGISSSAASFTDVSANTDYENSILWMADNGVINGYPDGSFQPDKCVNRVEFLKMLYKTLEVDTSAYGDTQLFSDTPADSWYAEFVKTARARKSIQGFQDGSYKPNQCVKRVEAIKIAVLEFNDNSIPNYSRNYGTVKDAPSTEWYYTYLHYALSANVLGLEHITQVDATSFNFAPGADMTRKEVAEMLYSMKTVKDNSLASYDENYEPNPLILKSAQVELKIDQIILTGKDKLEFDLYISRPDLDLDQQNIDLEEENPLTVDLPRELQPKLMYVSEVTDTERDSGTMCDRARFPHRCEVSIPQDVTSQNDYTYLIRITFEDNSYAAKQVTVPYPKTIQEPEISLPAVTPEQNSSFDITFKDVEGMEYEVDLALCQEYGNDGINPCLEGRTYTITNDDGEWSIDNSEAKVKVEDGMVRVYSNFKLDFEDSMSYTVTAFYSWITDDGIKTTISSDDSVSFTYVPEI